MHCDSILSHLSLSNSFLHHTSDKPTTHNTQQQRLLTRILTTSSSPKIRFSTKNSPTTTKDMSLKLFAMPISQPARAVIWLLEWKGVDYETVNTMPGGRKANGTKHPSFLKKFPMVRVVRRSRCSIETHTNIHRVRYRACPLER